MGDSAGFEDWYKTVKVYRNGAFGEQEGKSLQVSIHWTLDELLNHASRRIGLRGTAAKNIFNSNGNLVEDTMLIEDSDIIFLSLGEPFTPPMVEPAVDDAGHLPPMVCGYKIGTFLGRGGFGEVRMGAHSLTGERGAVKFINKSQISSIAAAERATAEIQCMQALRHPNVIRLMAHEELQDHLVLVFELMEGGDLYDHLAEEKGNQFSECVARAVFQQILSGVAYAHNQHICHRDLKLDNVLLEKRGSLDVVKVADFGLSTFFRPGHALRTNCGSLSYLAPEVFSGEESSGPPIDVWSLGVMLFAMVCGRLPFEGHSLRDSSQVNAGPPRPYDAVERRVRARIVKAKFEMDESLSNELKDLLRRMLRVSQSERASMPDIVNHQWMRMRPTTAPEPDASYQVKVERDVHEPGTETGEDGGELKDEDEEKSAPFSELRSDAGSTVGKVLTPVSMSSIHREFQTDSDHEEQNQSEEAVRPPQAAPRSARSQDSSSESPLASFAPSCSRGDRFKGEYGSRLATADETNDASEQMKESSAQTEKVEEPTIDDEHAPGIVAKDQQNNCQAATQDHQKGSDNGVMSLFITIEHFEEHVVADKEPRDIALNTGQLLADVGETLSLAENTSFVALSPRCAPVEGNDVSPTVRNRPSDIPTPTSGHRRSTNSNLRRHRQRIRKSEVFSGSTSTTTSEPARRVTSELRLSPRHREGLKGRESVSDGNSEPRISPRQRDGVTGKEGLIEDIVLPDIRTPPGR